MYTLTCVYIELIYRFLLNLLPTAPAEQEFDKSSVTRQASPRDDENIITQFTSISPSVPPHSGRYCPWDPDKTPAHLGGSISKWPIHRKPNSLQVSFSVTLCPHVAFHFLYSIFIDINFFFFYFCRLNRATSKLSLNKHVLNSWCFNHLTFF